MKKLKILVVLLIAVSEFALGAAAQATIKPAHLPALGTADHLAYVDFDKLPKNAPTVRAGYSFFAPYSSKLKPDSFFRMTKWDLAACWSESVLRSGVAAYCFPYLKIGIHRSVPDYQKENVFVSFGNRPGIYVWHEPEENRYYLWSNYWNYEYAIGPFPGDPLTELVKAVKPSRKKRSFKDVRLEFVGQKWTYPNDTTPPRDHCSDCGYSPYLEWLKKYQSLTTRLRLVNGGKENLYYLANFYTMSTTPDGYLLTKDARRADWDRTQLPVRFAEGRLNSKWIAFPPGAAVEFNVEFQSFEGLDYAYVVILNDAPAYWDEVELSSAPLPAMKRVTQKSFIPRPAN